jgi:hypothetical protein
VVVAAHGLSRIFVNGVEAAMSPLGGFQPETRWDINIGRRPSPGPGEYIFGGILDEVSLYERALSAKELQSILSVGGIGKCGPPGPPIIVQQPPPLTAFAGDPASVSVLASGASPLHYQWLHSQTTLAGANAATLLLSNVQPPDAGPYSVVVSNGEGSLTSAVVTLTVLTPSSCAPLPTGAVAWWPMQFTGQNVVGNNLLVLTT